MDDEVERAWRAAEREPGVVVLDGFHALKHALRFGGDVRRVLTSDRAALAALAEELAADVGPALDELAVELPEPVLRSLVPRLHPTGVIAQVRRPSAGANREALARRPRRAPVVLLENPRNLGNVGAVIRLAAGFGATGVVTTGELDPWHPTVLRGSAGLHFATAVERLSLPELPDGPLYVLDPEGADIREVPFPDDALLAFGTERHGVSAELRARADQLVAVPMRPGVSSFNLATSVGMGLFHWMAGRPPGAGPDGR
ncbi:RNA methyltransferase [Streptomyces rubellomurinus]|uniref:rRNA methyltransferase n=2 Tax=Streptomyces TaxID=1883 RepID=A0A0F2THZ1_STRR3|nr:TrmH family RNA methyltransferase [Streptomyces rubellomurinus]KJS56640.1 rRNA methyltransferase [Streptomyces rubellomurinus subsp. indigoferus]KJS61337.1 rRNA methyltransferase [Streptomyces rubellomurinus]